MKISPIQNFYITNFSKNRPQKPKTSFYGDSFIKRSSTENIFNEGKSFKLDSYKQLSEDKKEILTEALDSRLFHIKNAGFHNYAMGLLLKNHLDKKYGEDNYIFECIGTSPAPIGRVLEFSGVEVHYLPISDLQEAYSGSAVVESNPSGAKEYKKFLSSQGIDENMLERNDKTYLFYDYTASGESLEKFEDMLFAMDIPTMDSRMKFESLNEDLKQIKVPENFKYKPQTDSYIWHFLASGASEDYGGVPHLPCKDIGEISNVIQKRTGYPERYFNFYTINKLNEDGLLKENPANKNSL